MDRIEDIGEEQRREKGRILGGQHAERERRTRG